MVLRAHGFHVVESKFDFYKHSCYTSQLKYVFRLEENASHVVRQNSLRPCLQGGKVTLVLGLP